MKTFLKKLIPFFAVTLAFVFQSCENKYKVQERKQTQKKVETIKISIPTDEITDEFYDAIFENNNQKVKQILETTFPANYEPKNKIPPLQAVIWAADNLYLAKLFVEGGAKINNEENPAVVVASEYGRLEILKYLIEKGSNIKNNDAFNTAGFHHFYEVAKFLLLSGANQEKGDIRGKLWLFEQATIKSDYEVLNALNLTKNDMNNNNCDGETALIVAIKQNNLEMVKYLIEKGVDKNKPETFDCGDDINYGKMPIQIAKDNNFQEIVMFLD